MAGRVITPEQKKFLKKFMLWIFFLFVLAPFTMFVVWFVCFLAYTGIIPWPHITSTQQFFVITGITMMMICTLLAIAGALGIILMPDWLIKLLWTGSIGGILLAVSKWFGAFVPS